LNPDIEKQSEGARKMKTAVLGAGTIGASWAALFLAAGHEVHVYDLSDATQNFVTNYIRNAWPFLQALNPDLKGEAPQANFHSRPEGAASQAEFIQESVPERLNVKLELFRRIEPYLDPRTIIASSTSGLLLSEMQHGFKDPSRIILGHPFNPPHLIPLVELLGNARTAEGVLDKAQAFYESCGKETIRLQKEVPGHVANRLQAALWREAISLVNEGVASVKDVDKAVSSGPGLRWAVMGPHMLFSLASGGLGMEGFIDRYGNSIQHWWKTMHDVTLSKETRKNLIEGVKAEEAGRTFEQLTDERDRKLITILKALAVQ
jgi:3-hydroxybutyryl-CoA dehydrogenase